MRSLLSTLLVGASLLTAQSAYALTVESHSTVAPNGRSQFVDPDEQFDPSASSADREPGLASDGIGWHERSAPHSDSPFSFGITGGTRETERDSPFRGMEPGSGFRNLNQ